MRFHKVLCFSALAYCIEILEEFAKQQEEIERKKETGEIDEEEYEGPQEPPKNYTELDRLAYVVRAIDFDCAALPVGALKLTPNHELRYNDSFKGLSTSEAADLSNYQHFRQPVTEEMKEFICKSIISS
jgi:hypothetical protein